MAIVTGEDAVSPGQSVSLGAEKPGLDAGGGGGGLWHEWEDKILEAVHLRMFSGNLDIQEG